MNVRLALTDAEIDACWPVMHQLRPHVSRELFLPQIRLQQPQCYQLAAVWEDRPAAVAGFRICENLAWGVHLYVDDLVTDDHHRSRGYGAQLLAWLIAHARAHGCVQLHLDSGVQRFAAHRFYLRWGMRISSHHFTLDLAPAAE